MPDLATLSIKIESGDVKTAEGSLSSFSKTAADTEARVQRFTSAGTDMSASMKEAGGAFGKVGEELLAMASGAAAAYLSYEALKKTTELMFERQKDFTEALTKTQSALGLSAQEATAFGNGIIAISSATGQTLDSVLNLSRGAAALGITGTEGVIAYTKAMVDLGEAFGPAAEQLVGGIGRLVKITGEGGESAIELANAFGAVGGKSVEAKASILEMATVIAQGSSAYGSTAQGAVALATAMQKIGLEGGRAGAAVNAVFLAIDDAANSGGAKAAEILELTGKSAGDLQGILQRDSTAAFQIFIDGLRKVQDEGGNTRQALQLLGLSSGAVARTLPLLAAQNEKLAASIRLVADESASGNALSARTVEADISLEKGLESLSRSFENLFVKVRTGKSIFATFVGEASEALQQVNVPSGGSSNPPKQEAGPSLSTASKGVEDAQARLNALQGGGLSSTEALIAAQGNLAEALGVLQKVQNDTANAADALAAAQAKHADTIANLVSIVTTARDTLSSLWDILKTGGGATVAITAALASLGLYLAAAEAESLNLAAAEVAAAAASSAAAELQTASTAALEAAALEAAAGITILVEANLALASSEAAVVAGVGAGAAAIALLAEAEAASGAIALTSAEATQVATAARIEATSADVIATVAQGALAAVMTAVRTAALLGTAAMELLSAAYVSSATSAGIAALATGGFQAALTALSAAPPILIIAGIAAALILIGEAAAAISPKLAGLGLISTYLDTQTINKYNAAMEATNNNLQKQLDAVHKTSILWNEAGEAARKALDPTSADALEVRIAALDKYNQKLSGLKSALDNTVVSTDPDKTKNATQFKVEGDHIKAAVNVGGASEVSPLTVELDVLLDTSAKAREALAKLSADHPGALLSKDMIQGLIDIGLAETGLSEKALKAQATIKAASDTTATAQAQNYIKVRDALQDNLEKMGHEKDLIGATSAARAEAQARTATRTATGTLSASEIEARTALLIEADKRAGKSETQIEEDVKQQKLEIAKKGLSDKEEALAESVAVQTALELNAAQTKYAVEQDLAKRARANADTLFDAQASGMVLYNTTTYAADVTRLKDVRKYQEELEVGAKDVNNAALYGKSAAEIEKLTAAYRKARESADALAEASRQIAAARGILDSEKNPYEKQLDTLEKMKLALAALSKFDTEQVQLATKAREAALYAVNADSNRLNAGGSIDSATQAAHRKALEDATKDEATAKARAAADAAQSDRAIHNRNEAFVNDLVKPQQSLRSTGAITGSAEAQLAVENAKEQQAQADFAKQQVDLLDQVVKNGGNLTGAMKDVAAKLGVKPTILTISGS